ncbi:hypothetical protein B0H14DRAFT_636132 [Mycena olivaceomarginata]|nr:hypothetical protein B0H14DRAFT_636132 [Mycena olivaceomarginata]
MCRLYLPFVNTQPMFQISIPHQNRCIFLPYLESCPSCPRLLVENFEPRCRRRRRPTASWVWTCAHRPRSRSARTSQTPLSRTRLPSARAQAGRHRSSHATPATAPHSFQTRPRRRAARAALMVCCSREAKRVLRMGGTMGGSDASGYEVQELDASDPDSDIPDELQVILASGGHSPVDDTLSFLSTAHVASARSRQASALCAPLQSIGIR